MIRILFENEKLGDVSIFVGNETKKMISSNKDFSKSIGKLLFDISKNTIDFYI